MAHNFFVQTSTVFVGPFDQSINFGVQILMGLPFYLPCIHRSLAIFFAHSDFL